MKFRALLSLLFLFSLFTQVDAQIWKKVKNAAKRGVERTVENRTQREASRTTDEVIDAALGRNKNKSSSKTRNTPEPIPQNQTGSLEDNSSIAEIGENEVGFKRGTSILFTDDFSKDAIGDFPAKWNTNLGGEIKKLNGFEGKWLKVTAGSIINLEMSKPLPPNFTVELDIILPGDVEYVMAAIGFKEDKKRFDTLLASDDGFGAMFYSRNKEPNFKFGNRSIGWVPRVYDYPFNQKIHVAFEVNNYERIRIYVDGVKLADVPREFKPAYAKNFILNAMTHGAPTSKLNYFYVSNVVIAQTGMDQRSQIQKDLLEKGTFSSSDILFATGSDQIEPSSNKILDEVGQLMASDNWNLTIIGHTDSDGDAKANESLSLNRANSVKSYLISNHGINMNRIQVMGKGESEPIADNSTVAGKAQNRRVEFKKQ